MCLFICLYSVFFCVTVITQLHIWLSRGSGAVSLPICPGTVSEVSPSLFGFAFNQAWLLFALKTNIAVTITNWALCPVKPAVLNPITGGGGGGGAESPPRLVFLLSTENGLRWGLEISWLFLHIHWECCAKFLSFYFAQRRLQDHFLGGMFAKFRPFFQIFGNCKNLIVWLTCLLRNLSCNLAEIVQETTKL